MKIGAVSTAPITSINPNEGHSASPDRVARAMAAMAGQEIPQPTAAPDAQVERAQASIKKIKMRTQRSPNRVIEALPEENTEPAQAEAATETPTESATLATNEPAQAPAEVTQPLSPQFAALAKAKRALQAKERELATREEALNTTASSGYTKDQIKANALSILREAGVTNDELTEAILRESQDYGPAYSKLESEIQSLRQAMESQTKGLAEQEQATERQVLAQVRKDVETLISQGDEYEAVREAGYAPKVVDLMYRVFKTEGTLLDVSEAAQLVENELIEESLKFAALKKVQSRLKPPAPPEQPQPAKQSAPNTKIMRTLTNRDGASAISMSKRERAIAAMEGRLK